jgi:dienelactone hydrolase
MKTFTSTKRVATLALAGALIGPGLATLVCTRAAAAPDRDGPFAVGARMETFVDSTRSTPANGDVPESPTRTLEALIVYPARGEPNRATLQGVPRPADLVAALAGRDPARGKGSFPLIVYAHGFSGGYVSPFLQPLAEAGYVVVAPAFPLSNYGAAGGPTAADYANQPGDISFVISEMLDLPRRHRDLRRIIDPKAVGVTGASLGAATVMGVGFNSCCQDRRIKAAASIAGGFAPGVAGVEAPYPNGRYFTGKAVPLLVIHGTADPAAPYAGSSQLYADAPAPKFFVTLEDAPHIRFGPPWEQVAISSQIAFFDRYLKSDEAALESMARDGNVTGVARLESSPKTESTRGRTQ